MLNLKERIVRPLNVVLLYKKQPEQLLPGFSDCHFIVFLDRYAEADAFTYADLEPELNKARIGAYDET